MPGDTAIRQWDTLVGRVMKVCVSTFGQTARYQAAASLAFGETAPDPFEVEGIFDPDHIEVDANGTVPVNMIQPIFTLAGDQLPRDPYQGDFLTINGAPYTVADAQPDGAGNWRLYLHSGQTGRW